MLGRNPRRLRVENQLKSRDLYRHQVPSARCGLISKWLSSLAASNFWDAVTLCEISTWRRCLFRRQSRDRSRGSWRHHRIVLLSLYRRDGLIRFQHGGAHRCAALCICIHATTRIDTCWTLISGQLGHLVFHQRGWYCSYVICMYLFLLLYLYYHLWWIKLCEYLLDCRVYMNGDRQTDRQTIDRRPHFMHSMWLNKKWMLQLKQVLDVAFVQQCAFMAKNSKLCKSVKIWRDGLSKVHWHVFWDAV